jgi:hypothetical protein
LPTICIIGAGTYGSYLANTLLEKDESLQVILVEVGGPQIENETEAGYASLSVNHNYNATTRGRYFGLGGTSAMWGGQLLFFSNNDCRNDQRIRDVVNCNIEYKDKVLSRFFKKEIFLEENVVNEGLYKKQGVWLKFGQRNMFRHFNIGHRKNIRIIEKSRVISINHGDGIVRSISVMKGNEITEVVADKYYLTSGAFENARLMATSGLGNLKELTRGFADHVSMRCFRINNATPIVQGIDLQYQFKNNSLITSRLIGEIDGNAYYMQPVFNEKFIVFQALKNMIFKKKFYPRQFIAALSQAIHIPLFMYAYFVKKRLYVYKSWDINIDMEVDGEQNVVSLGGKDRMGQSGIEINFTIPQTTLIKLEKAKDKIRSMLQESKIDFTELADAVSVNKLEDTYHPYNFYNAKNLPIEKIIQPLDNLFQFSTGILSRAGGLNPSATVFCIIEKHVHEEYSRTVA